MKGLDKVKEEKVKEEYLVPRIWIVELKKMWHRFNRSLEAIGLDKITFKEFMNRFKD